MLNQIIDRLIALLNDLKVQAWLAQPAAQAARAHSGFSVVDNPCQTDFFIAINGLVYLQIIAADSIDHNIILLLLNTQTR